MELEDVKWAVIMAAGVGTRLRPLTEKTPNPLVKVRRIFLNNYDSCSAVLALIAADSALDGTVYNVATDEEISIIELVKMCAAKMGIEHPIIEFSGYRESDPERRLLSTEKIRERTSWRSVVNLDKGLDECISNYLRNI